MLLVLQLISFSATPCTIFVLTGTDRTLFFNNEDYSNPTTWLWFRPSGKSHFGCAFVGFDNGWAQGGVNENGLAFDWVAGFPNQWTPDESLETAQGNTSERMLESCSTISEAIEFYQKYQEPGFTYAKILIADKTGASVIIGIRDGNLHFDQSRQSRGFGYGQKVLASQLSGSTEPTISNGRSILQACRQKGTYATKYSNVFDLRSGEIQLVGFSENRPDIRLNLNDELSKGQHYYEISNINSQLLQEPIDLLPAMKRFLWEGYQDILDKNPALTNRVKQISQEALVGNPQRKDYTPVYWKEVSQYPQPSENAIRALGNLLAAKACKGAGDSQPVFQLVCD
ncbi:hypothetical protein [Dyadobacter pollutisoli]|uniref:Uncharacterized protein n=1 Tax=Dyadobacter pollutisoli TaxID=2910158 RepID=A0A9E8NDV9_9BACT|nr:hypothetical protein [Dyadobacter pollutisoli]WAC12507.1 hypothetical protein ON006_00805 [Dyadobacter pollutisoli]